MIHDSERHTLANGSIKVDQAEVVRRLEGNNLPAERPGAPMAFGDDDGQPYPRVSRDLVEVSGPVVKAQEVTPGSPT